MWMQAIIREPAGQAQLQTLVTVVVVSGGALIGCGSLLAWGLLLSWGGVTHVELMKLVQCDLQASPWSGSKHPGLEGVCRPHAPAALKRAPAERKHLLWSRVAGLARTPQVFFLYLCRGPERFFLAESRSRPLALAR